MGGEGFWDLKQYSDEAKIIWVKIGHGKKENERTIQWSDEVFI